MSFEEVWEQGLYISQSIFKEEGEVLYKQVMELPDKPLILEIGAYVGRSTHVLATTAKLKGGRVLTIDPFLPAFDGWHHTDPKTAFMDNIMNKFDNVFLIEDYSQNVADQIDDEFDFIFIDGDHSFEGVKRDCENYLPKLKQNHCVSFHDYHGPSWEGLRTAVDTYCADWSVVNNAFSLTTRRKP